MVTFSGKIYQNIEIDEDPAVEIAPYPKLEDCKTSGKIKASYIEKHYASLLYLRMEDDSM